MEMTQWWNLSLASSGACNWDTELAGQKNSSKWNIGLAYEIEVCYVSTHSFC